MGDWGAAPAAQGGLLAETLGLAMARRAAEVLSRHRAAVTGPDDAPERDDDRDLDPAQHAADDAIFTAVLDAANECLGRYDGRPASDRWCDALSHVLRLAEFDPRR